MRHYRNRRTVRQRRQISYQNDGRYFKWGYVKKSDGKDWTREDQHTGKSDSRSIIKRPIYMRNMDDSFNKKGPIENTVEVNIYYQKYRERTEIDVIDS